MSSHGLLWIPSRNTGVKPNAAATTVVTKSWIDNKLYTFLRNPEILKYYKLQKIHKTVHQYF